MLSSLKREEIVRVIRKLGKDDGNIRYWKEYEITECKKIIWNSTYYRIEDKCEDGRWFEYGIRNESKSGELTIGNGRRQI